MRADINYSWTTKQLKSLTEIENHKKANYIELITKSQVQEPIRKNPESPVQIETFEFFINLLNIPLPNSEDERFD